MLVPVGAFNQEKEGYSMGLLRDCETSPKVRWQLYWRLLSLCSRPGGGDTRDCSLLPWPGAGLDAAAKSPTDPAALSYNAGPATQAAGLNISNIQTAVPVFLLSWSSAGSCIGWHEGSSILLMILWWLLLVKNRGSKTSNIWLKLQWMSTKIFTDWFEGSLLQAKCESKSHSIVSVTMENVLQILCTHYSINVKIVEP